MTYLPPGQVSQELGGPGGGVGVEVGFAWKRLHGEPGHAGQAAVVTSGQGPTSHSAFVLGFARRMTG